MSIYDTEFSRRIRSSVPPSPGSSPRYIVKGVDVFGDITLPMRNDSPREMSPMGKSPMGKSPMGKSPMGKSSMGKGKGVMRDYGDR